MALKFRVELVWEGDDKETASSIYLTGDGRVILQSVTIDGLVAKPATLTLEDILKPVTLEERIYEWNEGELVVRSVARHVAPAV